MSETDLTRQFVNLLTRHERGVYAFILCLVPNWADAEEILQETNLKLWEEFKKFTPGTEFGAWARTVAKYQVLSYRKRKSRQPTLHCEELLDQVAASFDRLSTDELLQRRHLALARCMNKLDEKKRALLRMYYATGATGLSVAREVGRSAGSLKVSVFRIRKTLHDCIERQLRTGAI